MKVKDIVQEGVVSNLAKDLVGDTNWRAIQLRKQQKAQAQQQADVANQPEPSKLNPLAQTNPARTGPAPVKPVVPSEPEKVELTPGVRVVKAVDPTILSYNNKNFTRQANGQWTKLGQTKAVDLNTQQFLDSELAKL